MLRSEICVDFREGARPWKEVTTSARQDGTPGEKRDRCIRVAKGACGQNGSAEHTKCIQLPKYTTKLACVLGAGRPEVTLPREPGLGRAGIPAIHPRQVSTSPLYSQDWPAECTQCSDAVIRWISSVGTTVDCENRSK